MTHSGSAPCWHVASTDTDRVSATQRQSAALQDATVYPASLLEVGTGTRVQGPTGHRPTLLCVISGTAQLALEGYAAVTVRSGSAVLIPARANAMICHRGRGKKIVAESVSLLPCGELPRTGTFCSEGKPLRALAAPVAYRVPEPEKAGTVLSIDLSGIGNLRFAFEAMRGEIERERSGVRLLAGALLKTCLVHLHRRHFPEDDSQLGTSRIATVIAEIRDNPGAAHTVDTLARAAGMSRSNFARHFQREAGVGPMAYVSKARLDHAAEMLQKAALPIKVVAAECGFASRSHFSRSFRRTFGVDPSAFRRGGTAGE